MMMMMMMMMMTMTMMLMMMMSMERPGEALSNIAQHSTKNVKS